MKLGMTGMDARTESALTEAFHAANQAAGGGFELVPASQAQVMVVDMDSLYGPMSFMQLHTAGTPVIGYTQSPRTNAEWRLGRPLDTSEFTQLLREVMANGGQPPAERAAPTAQPIPPQDALTPHKETLPEETAHRETQQTPQAHVEPASIEAAAIAPTLMTPRLAEQPPAPGASAFVASPPMPPQAVPATPSPTLAPVPPLLDTAAPHGMTPAPSPQDTLPAPAPAITAAHVAAVPTPAAQPITGDAAADTNRLGAISAEPPVAAAPARMRTLHDWLGAGLVNGPVRFQREGGPPLLLNPATGQYRGPDALKGFAGYFTGEVADHHFSPISEEEWQSGPGDAQPVSRLSWLGALLAAEAGAPGGLPAHARFRLLKWPRTEREYPKHFRIATAMMKGPATIADIAAAAGVEVSDVAGFVNASLATGFAEASLDGNVVPLAQLRLHGG